MDASSETEAEVIPGLTAGQMGRFVSNLPGNLRTQWPTIRRAVEVMAVAKASQAGKELNPQEALRSAMELVKSRVDDEMLARLIENAIRKRDAATLNLLGPIVSEEDAAQSDGSRGGADVIIFRPYPKPQEEAGEPDFTR